MTYVHPLHAAIDAARAAGDLLRQDFHRPGGPRGQGSHAEADEPAERLIRELLLAACPWGFRGEETGFVPRPEGEPHLWLVDPNDGTSAYLKGCRGSAVSVAALRDGVPVLGVVYAFASPDDDGDLIAWAEGCGPVTRNGRPLATDQRGGRLGRGAVVFLKNSADGNPVAHARHVAPARYLAVPSIAYRLALVAAGEGVAAVCLRSPWSAHGPHGWDYAAGHALLRGVNGVLLDESGRAVTYPPDGDGETRGCFGGAAEAAAELAGRSWDDTFAPPTQDPGLFSLARLMPGQAVADRSRLARAQGCWLGQLAGDSLGSLVEFQPARQIASRYPRGVRHLADGGAWDTLAGQPTDDSELALMLARTLVREGRYDAGAVRSSYVHWYRSHPFDVGGTIGLALGQGRPNPDSQANGSLMRISPLGIAGAGRPGAAAWARADSALTHPHPVCQEACAAFVTALAVAIDGDGGPEAAYAAAVAEAASDTGQRSVQLALAEARHAPPRDYESRQGWVLIALQNAFYQLLHAASLEEGLVHTVGQGGDTDTNAAIAGALLGAVHGREAVPAAWRRAVRSCRPLREVGAQQPRPKEFWPVDALELAERLLMVGWLDVVGGWRAPLTGRG
jgi:ADP-ribosylglycohydrolase/fructose-1,6-bisphosphatase/inositol monophosphatase family enzyme